MKLPEHYERWVEDQAFASHSFRYVEDAFESGAEAMYRKLMEDMRPAIEALKHYESGTWKIEYIDEFISTAAKQALAALKEKGLVE